MRQSYPRLMVQQTPRRNALAQGIVLILAAALVISVQDVLIKLFSGEMTLWQIFALRGLIVVPILLGYVLYRDRTFWMLRQALGLWPMLRAMFITTTFLCYYAAIGFLSLSTAGAANYTAPIFITVMTAVFLNASVTTRGWFGVALGFVGVIILLRPGTDVFSPWAALPLLGAMFYALAHIVTNARCHSTPLPALALSQSLVMMVAGFLASGVMMVFPSGALSEDTPYIFGQWATMTPELWAVLAVLSVFAIGAAVLLAGAYQVGPPVIMGTLEYSYLVFVLIWDTAIFGLIPDGIGLIGIVLIVAAGLIVIHGSARRVAK